MRNNFYKDLIFLIKNNYINGIDINYTNLFLSLKTYIGFDYSDNKLMEQILDLLNFVKDEEIRIRLIELIVEFDCFEISKYKLLLDEYIHLSKINNIDILSIQDCLSAFITAGANEKELFDKITSNFDEEITIEIFRGMDLNWNFVNEDNRKLYEKVQFSKKLTQRIYVISTFLTIVHPLCSRYSNIYSLSSANYKVLAAINDWGWSEVGSTKYLLDDKIITQKEGEILESLGYILKCNSNYNISKFKELYDDFFENNNPIDVMYTLPI